MKYKYNIAGNMMMGLAICLAFSSCQKLSKPAMGAYPVDANPPGGALKFYAAFDGSTPDPLMNAVDSIRANFASKNPLASIAGISGKAIQAADGKGITYSSANDLNKATSLTVAFWMKNTVPAGRTEFVFSLVDDTYGWGHSALFLMFENQTASKTTMKFGVMDQWLEFAVGSDLQKPLFNGQWHHLAFAYDQATSKVSYYVDGIALTGLAAGQTDVKKNGNPRGALDLTKSSQLVIGSWNKQVGITGPTDDWVKSFTGGIDQFRLYNKALNAAEVAALFNSKL